MASNENACAVYAAEWNILAQAFVLRSFLLSPSFTSSSGGEKLSGRGPAKAISGVCSLSTNELAEFGDLSLKCCL